MGKTIDLTASASGGWWWSGKLSASRSTGTQKRCGSAGATAAERPEETESKRQRKYNWYRCRCTCGREVVKNGQYLAEAKRPNCGCRQREVKPASRKIGHDGQYVKLVRPDGTLQAQSSNGEMYGVMRNDRKCAQCKKTFDMYAGPQWAWRKQYGGKILVFCSYGCIRKHDVAHPQKFTTVKY